MWRNMENYVEYIFILGYILFKYMILKRREEITMKSLLSKTMNIIGVVSLFIGAIVIVPTSLLSAHQPKCPDELLK